MRTDQLRWAEPARRTAVQRERERSQRGGDVAQQDICSAVAISPGNGQSFCGKYSQCFCFCTESFSCFFKLLFYFRNFQRPRQIPDYKNFTAYLWQLLLLQSLLQGAWHLSTYAKEDIPRREKQETDGARNRNRNQNRIDMNCERLRYFRFGHLPDYFVLCLRIGASSKHCTAVKVGEYRGGKWSSQVNTRKRSRDLPCSSGLLFKAHAKCHCQLSEARLYRYLTG